MKKYLFSFLFVALSFILFAQITFTPTINNVSCFGGTNGSISISVNGGVAPYSFAWSPNGLNSPNNSNLTAGVLCTATVTVTAKTQDTKTCNCYKTFSKTFKIARK